MGGWSDAEEKVYGALAQIASKLLVQGIDVILDYGFWYKRERTAAMNLASSVGAAAIIHFLDTPEALRRERILVRNKALDTDSVEISIQEFDKQLDWFEKPSESEGLQVEVILDKHEI